MRSLQQGSDIARIAGLLALGTLGLHLVCGGNYGWFRDEMYFLACGRRLAVGALTGIGILNKHSFAFYAVCLLAGVLTEPKLRSRRILLAPAIAALIVLPHAIWQVRNGFPMLELLAAQKWKNAPWTL